MSALLFLTFVCCVGAQNIQQPKHLQTSKLGDNVTIECYLPNQDFNNMVWYKQEMGMKLQIISESYIYLTKVDFADGYNDGRFTVTISTGIYHLHISLTKKEDVGTYFCGVLNLGELDFGPGTFLMLNEHTSKTVLQEPISDEVHIGDNITLTCRVQTVDKKCKGAHHAYWFREAAEESSPAIIYTDDMKKHEEICKDYSTAQTCIYSLTKRNLSLSDAGTYYCAVLACGKIMFGNGTSLEISSIPDSELTTSPSFLILALSNIISMLIMILLVAVQCKDQGSSSVNRSCNQETSECTQVGDADALTYTSVSFSSKSRPSRGAKQHNISQHTDVYSQIRS
uniref:Polymeric immunoglobulin receptor-like n=1 Tax=Cyprinus carpio TaxID=7962 RepID=A0A8C2HJ31_CYPCA